MHPTDGSAVFSPLLLTAPLFAGFSEDDLAALLPYLAPTVRRFEKGETLLQAGDAPGEVGVLLAGRAEAMKYTGAGGEFLVARLLPGRVYGDVLFGSHQRSPVRIFATAPAAAMLLPGKTLLAGCPQHEGLSRRLLANLVAEISDKYFALDKRLDLLLIRHLRRRLAAFLLDLEITPGAPFIVPYNRTQLAAFLGCERSALCREVSRMAADGLIEVHRATFRITGGEALRALL